MVQIGPAPADYVGCGRAAGLPTVVPTAYIANMTPRPPASAPTAIGASDRPRGAGGSHAAASIFESVFDAAPAGMALVRPDGRLARVNRAFERVLGVTADRVADRFLVDLVHPDDRDELSVEIAILLAAREGDSAGEQRWLRGDGGVIHVRSHIGVVDGVAEGEPPLVVSLEDVTAERRVHDALAMSDIRHRALVDNLSDTAIGIFDGNLRLVIVEGGSGRPDVSRAEFEGRLLSELMPPERYRDVEAHFHAALLGEHRTFDYTNAQGTTWWTQVAPLTDDAGRVLGGIAVWRDVTARKRAEDALAHRARELERSNAELEQFAYVASHDLSEPLRMVTSYLQLLERRYKDALDEDASEFIHYAVDGASRMRALIDDLLAYSRVGRHDRPLEEVDLQAVVTRVVQVLTAGREDGGRIVVGPLPVVSGDQHQITQLFQNLLGNGLKFRHPERPALVEVTAEPVGSRWRITVADNGIGIDPAHAERIFGVFQRLHARDEYPGTGVGLAIARKVVERHGGSIWVEPGPEGGGTRFCFELPGADG